MCVYYILCCSLCCISTICTVFIPEINLSERKSSPLPGGWVVLVTSQKVIVQLFIPSALKRNNEFLKKCSTHVIYLFYFLNPFRELNEGTDNVRKLSYEHHPKRELKISPRVTAEQVSLGHKTWERISLQYAKHYPGNTRGRDLSNLYKGFLTCVHFFTYWHFIQML